ncbi:MAG: carboxypeptidase regulatory-like domain-containing protein [Acidobacteria bacterium]|nr:carboxypeptidase regulatory-like domain-containing protein [Acidobacteriota bacterium]
MKKFILIGALTAIAVTVFFGWGSITEVSAKIAEYFYDDPDRSPTGAEFDEAEYILRRDQYIALLRGVDPERPADPQSRTRAVELMNGQADKLKRTRFAKDALLAAWTELGPNPIPNGQTQSVTTPVSGRVTAIEIDPTDPNKVYVGAAQGGIFRSLDGGATWTPIFDGAQTLAIGALTLDPATNRLWVGTGEANGSADSFAGVGLYRINDPAGAATLVGPINPVRTYFDSGSNLQSTPAFNGRSISKILINPTDPNELLVGAAGGVIGLGGNPPFGNVVPPLAMRGLYKISNAGGAPATATATRVAVSTTNTGLGLCLDLPCTVNRSVNDMVFDLSDPTGNTVIVWLNGINIAGDGGIYRSTNAFDALPTFTQTFVTPATSTSNGRGMFAVAQQGVSPARIYVASGEPSTGGSLCNSASNAGGLRRSTDGGQTWSAELPGGGGFCSTQCFYNIAIDLVPGVTSTTDKILLGGNVRSTSCAKLQGTSLDGAATAFSNTDVGVHADSHVIKIAPSNPLVVYRGDDGGIWKSVDGGATWASLNNTTFRATQFQSIAVHPSDPNFTIGGTQDNGTEKMTTGPTWIRSQAGDGGFTAIDQNAADTTNVTMYHTFFNQLNSQIGYERSTNAGTSWTFLGCSGGSTTNGVACSSATTTAVNFYAPVALGPGNPNTIYLGTDRLLRSATTGTANATVSQAPLVSGVPISAIGISPQDDNYRIVGLNNGALFFTTTGSTTLTSLDPTGGGSVIPDFYVARLAFDPTNKNTVYISLGNYSGGTSLAQSHVWKVTNLNTTPVLTPINGATSLAPTAATLPDVPVNAFAVDPSNPNFLYAGTDIGVYLSTDGGTNWNPYGTGLPRVAVFDMAIAPGSPRQLRIATHGRGMWQIPVFAPTAANVSIAGRILAPDGRGLSNAIVALTNADGQSISVRSNSFGHYRFDELASGQTVTVNVSSKGYVFDPQVINLSDNLEDLNFTGREGLTMPVRPISKGAKEKP